VKKKIDMESVKRYVENFDETAALHRISPQAYHDANNNVWGEIYDSAGGIKYDIYDGIVEDLGG